MTYIFTAHLPDLTTVAIFFDHEAAAAFAKEVNDEYQAEIITVDSVALVDRYGFPIAVREIGVAGLAL